MNGEPAYHIRQQAIRGRTKAKTAEIWISTWQSFQSSRSRALCESQLIGGLYLLNEVDHGLVINHGSVFRVVGPDNIVGFVSDKVQQGENFVLLQGGIECHRDSESITDSIWYVMSCCLSEDVQSRAIVEKNRKMPSLFLPQPGSSS
jgi:hypothetical protein